MARRKKRCGPIAYKRCVTTNARPVRGKPWRKTAKLLEELQAKHGYKAFGMGIFKLLTKLATENGWRGNAVTEYAYQWYEKKGYSLTYNGLMEHVDGTEFGYWLDCLYRSTVSKRGVIEGKPVKAPRGNAAREMGAEDKRIAAIGAAFRAKVAEDKARQDKAAPEIMRNIDIQDIWRMISKGEFPLGADLFQAELERRAKLRVELTNKIVS